MNNSRAVFASFDEQIIQAAKIVINQNFIASGLTGDAVYPNFGKSVILYDMAYCIKQPFSVSF